ncbi:hypothetical protein [Singulisphaera sp. GP187]|uniref:hypothetical protein n=1 Tax=Singulisphaera sp. GP187 TaxID=1882752 RepID=UPI001160EDB0|nr:hypothetical protein [Singulisphaera sp. GP187]
MSDWAARSTRSGGALAATAFSEATPSGRARVADRFTTSRILLNTVAVGTHSTPVRIPRLNSHLGPEAYHLEPVAVVALPTLER